MNIVSESQEKRNTTTPELFSELKGLNGGEKQRWINDHLDFILTVSEVIEFDDLCRILHCKADTLASALRRGEGHHRPMITRADKALLAAQRADNKAQEALTNQAVLTEQLTQQINELADLKNNLKQYFEGLAAASTMMARIMSSVTRASKFTYHIGSPNKRKVGLTQRRLSGRLLNAVPERLQLSGQGIKKKTSRHSKQPFRRRPNV